MTSRMEVGRFWNDASAGELVLASVLCSSLTWFCLSDLELVRMIPVIGRRPESIIYFVILGLGLVWTPLRKIEPAFALLTLGLWVVVSFTPLARWMTAPLVEVTPLPADQRPADERPANEGAATSRTEPVADAVVVLASGVQLDNEMSDTSLARFMGGMEAVRQDLAPRLVLTEPLPPSGSHLKAARKVVDGLKLQLSIEDVGPVADTHDEAVAVADLARRNGWKSIILVTSPTHSRRSALVFRKAGQDFGWTVISRPCRETKYDLENLSYAPDRRLAFASAIHELIGIPVYRRRGWID